MGPGFGKMMVGFQVCVWAFAAFVMWTIYTARPFSFFPQFPP